MTRRKPYTERGIRRVPCRRCGRPSSQQWDICADGNVPRGLCVECDIDLNRLVLEWVGDPEADVKVAAYRAAIGTADA